MYQSLSREQIVQIWQLDPKLATEWAPAIGSIQFTIADYVEQLEAAIEPLVLASGAPEMGAAMFRIGKKIGSAGIWGGSPIATGDPPFEWDARMADHLARYVARSLKRVRASGVLDVQEIEVQCLTSSELIRIAVPWTGSNSAQVRCIRLAVTVRMNQRLVSRLASCRLARAGSIIARSPWRAAEEAVDAIAFFGRGLVTGVLERWLLATEIHQSILGHMGTIVTQPGELRRDLATAIASHCQATTADTCESRRTLIAFYVAPNDEPPAHEVRVSASHVD